MAIRCSAVGTFGKDLNWLEKWTVLVSAQDYDGSEADDGEE